MITSRYITPIVAVFMAFAVLFTGIAMAVQGSDSAVSAAVEKEYVNKIFSKDSVLDINIEMDQNDWDWIIKNATSEEYRQCDITINGKTYYNVGIRPKGNSSLSQVARDENSDRFSFKISFDQYVEGQNLYGLTSLALNNVMGDTTYMKEYLSYDLMASLDVPSPVCTYSNISVNDKSWGLYLAVEIIEESFLERYFGYGDYNLYKPEGMDMGNGGEIDKLKEVQDNIKNGNAQNRDNLNGNGVAANNQAAGQQGNGGMRQNGKGGFGGRGASGGASLKYTDDNPENYSVIKEGAVLKNTDDEDFKKVVTMIKALNSGEDLEKYIDVNEVLRYFAVNTFLVNLDSYSGGMYHNYYLFEENGLFKILPWDFNLSFAGHGVQSVEKAVNFPIDSPTTDSLENAPLIGKLLEVPEYKELYHKYLNQIVEYVGNGKFDQMVTNLDNLIGEYVKKDATAFFTYEQYKSSLPQLIQLTEDRTESIKAQLKGTQPSETYGNISTAVNLEALGSMFGGGKNFNNNRQGNMMPEGNNQQGGQMPGGNNQQGGQMPGGNNQQGGQMPGGNNQQGGQIPGGNNQQGEQMPGGNNQQGEQMPGGNNRQGGRMPGGNSQQGMQQGGQPPQMQAGGEMVDMDLMRKAFDIIGSAKDGELSADQINKLKEIGLTDAQISQIKNMAAGVMQRGAGGQFPGDFDPGGVNNRSFLAEGTKTGSREYILMAVVCGLFLAGGILFTLKYKRKRYTITK